jgi:hypothetical protein
MHTRNNNIQLINVQLPLYMKTYYIYHGYPNWLCHKKWRTPNSSKDPNVGPNKKHRKKKESGHTP